MTNGIQWINDPNKADTIPLKIKLLTSDAIMPTKAHDDDAAFDLYSAENIVMSPFEVYKISTGVAFELPEGYQMDVLTRSGMGSKGLDIVNAPGLIDPGYRGEIKIILRYIPSNYSNSIASLGYVIQDLIDFTQNPTPENSLGKWDLSRAMKELSEGYEVKKGDRIAQCQLKKIVNNVALLQVAELNESKRGAKGFGSSGS